MHVNDLSSYELYAALKKEQQYLNELKSAWLNSLDGGDVYDISVEYVDEFGFDNGPALNAWQVNTLLLLEEKPTHLSSINYLKSRGDTTSFNGVLFSHAISNERQYVIKRTDDEIWVRLVGSEEEFLFEMNLKSITYRVLVEFHDDQVIVSKGSSPALSIPFSMRDSGLIVGICDGLGALNVATDIQNEATSLILDFLEDELFNSNSFKRVCAKRGSLQ
jgi:hypothetical protein